MINTIEVKDVWEAVGVFNATNQPIEIGVTNSIKRTLNTICMSPIDVVLAARYYSVFEDIVMNGVDNTGKNWDKWQDFCVFMTSVMYGPDFYYYFRKGFDLLTSDLHWVKKFEDRLLWFKSGVLCRQKFVMEIKNGKENKNTVSV